MTDTTMTKPTMELVELIIEYGDFRGRAAMLAGSDEPGARQAHKAALANMADISALLSEIRQRLEAMERREAELESDLAEAARCAFEYAAKVGVLERDAARYRWLRDANNDPGHVVDKVAHPGMAMYRAGSELDAAIDAAMAEGEGS